MMPWALLLQPKAIAAIVLAAALAASHWFAYDTGKDVERAKHLALELERVAFGEEVRAAIAAGSLAIGAQVSSAIGGIQNKTVTINRQIEREKEVHHVLADPNCAVPDSVVRLRNEARVDPDKNRVSRERPDDGVRKPPASK